MNSKGKARSLAGKDATTEDKQLVYERRALQLICRPINEEPSDFDRILRVLTNAFAYHRIDSGKELLSAFSVDMRTPHSLLLKANLILFNNTPSVDINLATTLLESYRSFDVNKKELMLELLLILIRNYDRMATKQFVLNNQNLLSLKTLKKHSIIDAYLKAYISLVDYLLWKERTTNTYSDQVVADSVKLSLRNVIEQNKDTILDNFVAILIEMYENDDQSKDVMQVLTTYMNNNPNHLNAFIYLYKTSAKYPNQSNHNLKIEVLKKIASISPDNRLVLDLVKNDWVSIKDKFTILMEYVDYKQNRNDIDTLNLIYNLLDSIEQKSDLDFIDKSWKQFYKYYWIKIVGNARRSKPKGFEQNVTQIIECREKIIEFFK